jgi:hypothetical protein
MEENMPKWRIRQRKSATTLAAYVDLSKSLSERIAATIILPTLRSLNPPINQLINSRVRMYGYYGFASK